MTSADSASGGLSRRGSHRLSLAAICPRKWHFRFQRGIEPKKQVPHLVEGKLIHLALAYYWAEKMLIQPKWYSETSLDNALAREGKGEPKAIELALRVREAYKNRYHAFDLNRMSPVAVEYEFEATIAELQAACAAVTKKPELKKSPTFAAVQGLTAGDLGAKVAFQNETVTSRIDLLVRASSGGLWAVDFKTTARTAANSHRLGTWNPLGEYALSWQFLLQYGILKARLGDEFKGVIVERISKVWPYDFDRQVAPITLGPLSELPRIVQRLVRAERSLEDEAFAAKLGGDDTWMPDGHPWSCFSWGRPCEYRDLCLASDSPSAFTAILLGAYQSVLP